jgi:hypothetical protein
MDRLVEKLRPLIISACEQILVASVLAFQVITFALLTIPQSVSVASLVDLVWDQFSTPSPRAPAGDLTFRLLKIWTDHVIDVELPQFRNLFQRLAAQESAASASRPATQTLSNLLHVQRH